MAVKQLRTFGDILDGVCEELGISSNDTATRNKIRRDINICYSELLGEKSWQWLNGSTTLQLPPYYASGTASVAQGSNAVTLTSSIGASKTGYKIYFEGFSEIYTIDYHAAGSAALKLNELYAGATNSAVAFRIYTDKIPLPIDCKDVSNIGHDFSTSPLTEVGIQEFRRISGMASKLEAYPTHYCVGDYVDPAQTAAITSMPNLLTRASNGMVKTLVFDAAVPSSISTKLTASEPVKWRITASGHPSYNGDVFVASVTTTSVANDTITYVGRQDYTEAATSDSSMMIRALEQESSSRRYRELFLFPCINSSRVSLRLDYIKDVLPLENDSDEPIIPLHHRSVLLYAALHRAWTRNRNQAEADRNLQLYENRLAKLEGKLQDTLDKPRLSPSKLYMGAKRAVARQRGLAGGYGLGGFPAGGAGSRVSTGTPNKLAGFNASGELEATAIGTSEVNALSGVTGNVQTQLDGKQDAGDYITALTGDVTATGPTGGGSAAATISNLAWNKVSKTGSNLNEIATRSHTVLTDIGTNTHADIDTHLAATTGNVHSVTHAELSDKGTNDHAAIDTHIAATTGNVHNVTKAEVGLSNVTDEAQIAKSLIDAKGDLIVGSAADTPARLGIGADDTYLCADSTQPNGVKWAAAPGGYSVVSKVFANSPYTATASEVVLYDASGGAPTVNLPAAASNTNKVIVIKKIDSTANTITVDGNAAETIDGATTFSLTRQHDSVSLICSGTGWYII